jgi:glycosyltransferase Alg8
MWTSLVSPCLLLIAILKFNWIAVGLLVSWLVLSRSLTLIFIFWDRESPLKPIHLPILLFTQWSSALIKIWTLMNLPKQRWFNRGDRKLSSEGKAWIQWIRRATSSWMLWLQGFSFGLLLFALLGWVDPIQDTIGFFRSASLKEIPSLIYVEAANYGVVPNDGKDDALALQKLIDQLPAKELVKVKLPIGELDLFSALKLYRNHTILEGQGTGRTILKVHSSGNSTGIGNAGLLIQPSDQGSTTLLSANKTMKNSQFKAPLTDVEVRDITFTSDPLVKDKIAGIMIKDVDNISLKSLEFDSSFQDAILLDKEIDVHLEYITVNGSAIKNKSSIISQN